MGDRLKEKVALVSGAGSSGPGLGQRQGDGGALRPRGSKDLRSRHQYFDAALETKRIIEAEGGFCKAVSGNVSRAGDVAAIVDACFAAFGRIDVLYNNVGIVEVGGPVETSEESWDRINNVNLKSMFLTCKHVLPHMERQGKGAIVNIAAVSGHPLAWGSLHLLRCDEGRGHPVHELSSNARALAGSSTDACPDVTTWGACAPRGFDRYHLAGDEPVEQVIDRGETVPATPTGMGIGSLVIGCACGLLSGEVSRPDKHETRRHTI